MFKIKLPTISEGWFTHRRNIVGLSISQWLLCLYADVALDSNLLNLVKGDNNKVSAKMLFSVWYVLHAKIIKNVENFIYR